MINERSVVPSAPDNNFRGNGTSSCYKGTTFTFSGHPVTAATDGTVDPNTLTIQEFDYSSGEHKKISGWTAIMKDGKLVISVFKLEEL